MNIFPFPKPKFNYIFSYQIHLFHFYWVKIIDFLINNRRIIYSSSILYYSLSLEKNNFETFLFLSLFLPIFFFIHHWRPIQLDFFHDSFILSSNPTWYGYPSPSRGIESTMIWKWRKILTKLLRFVRRVLEWFWYGIWRAKCSPYEAIR